MEPLDWASLKENCAGEESLVAEILDIFRNESTSLMQAIRTAVQAADPAAVARAAHCLKGALVSLGAKPSMEVARAMELAGNAGDVSNAPANFAQLEKEMERLLAVIAVARAA